MNKSFAILAFLATTLAAGAVMAQALPEVKTGDKLTWLYTLYNDNAKQIIPLLTKEEVAVVTVNPASGDREYTYTDGTKLVTNNQFGPKKARDIRIFNENEMFNVLQGDPVIGQKWSFEASQQVMSALQPRCTIMQFFLTATVLPGPTVTIRVRGVDTPVKTFLVKQEGKRYYNPCTSGPAYFNYLYSPELKEVVEKEYFSYNRSVVHTDSSKTTLRAID